MTLEPVAAASQIPVTGVAYFVALMLVAVPILSILGFTDLRSSDPQWRFQAATTLLSALPPLVLGTAIAVFSARALGHRRVLWLTSLLALVGGLVLVLMVGNFILDALQLRSLVPAGEQAAYTRVVLKAILQAGLIGLALAAVGWEALRSARKMRRIRAAQSNAQATLVVAEGVGRTR